MSEPVVAVEQVVLPVESFKEAAEHLRRPFTPEAIKFKVQATWPKNAPASGLIVSYIDARLVVERLNLIVPHLWHDEYQAIGNGLMWCHLTVDGITRSDVGEGQGKGLVSDALKRAAVKFGVGVPLYAVPKMILNASGGHLKAKQTSKGPTLELTPNGLTHVQHLYHLWLTTHGIGAFGEPFDHGDVADAQGDIETGSDAPVESPAGAESNGHDPGPPESRRLNAAERDRVLSAIADTDQNEALLFAAVGISSAAQLTVEHANRIRRLIDQAVKA